MPTYTNKYPAGTAGGNSSDIVVDQGQQVSLVLAANIAGALPGGVQCQVQRKLNNGSYQNVPEIRGSSALLTTEAPEVVFSAPGTYRVVVPATSAAVVLEEYR